MRFEILFVKISSERPSIALLTKALR